MMEMETICEMCGDKGWENAFVFCVKCLEFAIHRYCLPVIPETFDEFVHWFCGDCKELYGKPYPTKAPSSVRSAKKNLTAAEETLCKDLKKRKHHKSTDGSSEIEPKLNVTKEKENASLVKTTDAKRNDKGPLQPCESLSELEESDKFHDSPPTRKGSKRSGKSRSKKKTKFDIPVDVITEPEEPKSQISAYGEPCEENKENLISDGDKLYESVADVARIAVDSQIVQVESSKVSEDSNHIRSQKPCGTLSELAKSDKKVHDSSPSRKRSKRSGKFRSKKNTKFCIPVDIVTEPEEQKGQISLSGESCEENKEKLISGCGRLCEAVAYVARIALDSQLVQVESSKVPENSYHIRSQKPCAENNENVVSEGSKLCEAAAAVASIALDSQIVPDHSSKVLRSCGKNGENLVSEDGKLCGTAADVASIPRDSQVVSADSSNVPEDSCYIPAQPVIDPIWSGNFNIETVEYGLYDGLVAHMSSKACPMACEEAKLFSESLCMELLPKPSVWPKSFQISEPSDDNIALYFFASNESYERVFDDLVGEMMSKELALRAVVTNAELLVFTSNELPFEYWKFNDKFYLWGVFRKKQALSSNSANHHLMVQKVKNGEDRNLTNKRC